MCLYIIGVVTQFVRVYLINEFKWIIDIDFDSGETEQGPPSLIKTWSLQLERMV